MWIQMQDKQMSLKVTNLEVYCFEDLQPAKVLEVINTEVIELKEVNSEDEEHLLKLRKPLEVKNIESTQKLKTQHEQQSQASDSESGEDFSKPADIN